MDTLISKTKTLYPFQEDALANLYPNTKKHLLIAGCGTGKNPMSMVWAGRMREKTHLKIKVVTTASKAKTTDHKDDYEAFTGHSRDDVEVMSWYKLKDYTTLHEGELKNYIWVFDEIQKGKAFNSGMGKALAKVARKTPHWVGLTATAGDRWEDYTNYAIITGYARSKTAFYDKHIRLATYKGYPEVIGYTDVPALSAWWQGTFYRPDTRQIDEQMPSETHKIVPFKAPSVYFKTLKTRETVVEPSGVPLDTAGALCAELRRLCFTKAKESWIHEFIESIDEGVVFFYQFKATGDKLEDIIKGSLESRPNNRVWRIDGAHHEIPTEETYKEGDVVLVEWQAGSEALNLQFIHLWVSVEPNYSYSTSIQARGRIKRDGQKKHMIFYYLLTDKTIEQDIMKTLKNKGKFSEETWYNERKEDE